MTNRDWFCLALRLFGIWLLIGAIETIVPSLLFFIGANGLPNNTSYLVSMFLWLIGRTAVGLGLLLFAPAIAARFYPATTSTEAIESYDEARPLKIGIQLLAVYALLLAVQAGAGVVFGLLSLDKYTLGMGRISNGGEENYLASLLTCGLNLAFAGILLIWNERVVTLIAKIRYIPERDAYKPPSESE